MRYSHSNAKKTMYAGVEYDSKLEASYAQFLDSELMRGNIDKWTRQDKFLLPNMDGKNSLRYLADFVVYSKGQQYIMEVKGRLLPENKVKYAYVQYVHNVKIYITSTPYNPKLKMYLWNFGNPEHAPWNILVY